MIQDLHVEILSPEGYQFNGSCTMATIPGVSGEMGIMANHESVLTALQAGKISIQDDKQNIIKELEITGGFAQTIGKKLLILVD